MRNYLIASALWFVAVFVVVTTIAIGYYKAPVWEIEGREPFWPWMQDYYVGWLPWVVGIWIVASLVHGATFLLKEND